MSFFKRYQKSEQGSVTVETSLIITILIVLTAGVVECSLAFWQWNSAQQSARFGARLAATSYPVAEDLRVMTGLENGAEVGDPFPYYERHCSGETASCSGGQFNQVALDYIIFGPDGDGVCSPTTPERRGICDIVSNIGRENMDISYIASGLGYAGEPGHPAPLITVTIKDLDFNFVFLDAFLPGRFTKIPPVSVSAMSEDLRSET